MIRALWSTAREFVALYSITFRTVAVIDRGLFFVRNEALLRKFSSFTNLQSLANEGCSYRLLHDVRFDTHARQTVIAVGPMRDKKRISEQKVRAGHVMSDKSLRRKKLSLARSHT